MLFFGPAVQRKGVFSLPSPAPPSVGVDERVHSVVTSRSLERTRREDPHQRANGRGPERYAWALRSAERGSRALSSLAAYIGHHSFKGRDWD